MPTVISPVTLFRNPSRCRTKTSKILRSNAAEPETIMV